MGWWPFSRRKKTFSDNPHMKGTRAWLTELRELAERNFNNHIEGQRLIHQLKVEWKEALSENEMSLELHEGLHRRAFRLLNADAQDWLAWLDDDDFWQPGWKGDDGVPTSH
ncbi:MAG: hypothetical protein QF440_04275 [Candidatus Thalassarchaeaceae archaeon]|jgi:hypothetical protein|nr:hypothetical protein [Candidatus Thalassarchaeaceae archaeon]